MRARAGSSWIKKFSPVGEWKDDRRAKPTYVLSQRDGETFPGKMIELPVVSARRRSQTMM